MIFVLIAVANAVAVRPERVVLFVIVAAIGAALPLSSAWRELRHPRDAEPLTINSNYRKEDRFFATSFASRVATTLGAPPREPGPYAVVFRDPEIIDTVAGSLTIEAGREPESILDLHEDLTVAANATMHKEALVGRDAILGDHCSIRALKAERDIRVGRNATVERWIDAGSTLYARAGTDLGVRATALGSIRLEPGVAFHFLSAPVVVVADDVPQLRLKALPSNASVPEIGGRTRIRADGAILVDGDFTLSPGTVCRADIVARGDVIISEGATLIGRIHSDGDITLANESRVTGSIVAEKNISIGAIAAVDEHAVAYGHAILRRGARVGTPDRITTLLADAGVELSAQSIVYGRVVTYGAGRTTL